MYIMNDDSIYLTESTLIRNLSRKQYEVLMDVSGKCNEIRNCAVEKTHLYKADDGIHYKKVDYRSISTTVKNSYPEIYSLVQAHIADATIKKHVESFNAYVVLLNRKIDGEYDKRLNKPKKHEHKRHNIIIPKESITSSKKKLSEGYVYLPLSRKYKQLLPDKDCRPRIKIPENLRDKRIIQIEIIPIDNGRKFKANFTYEVKRTPLGLDKDKVMGIDLGVNNFATLVTTEGTPYIVDGRYLKNQIHFKCKTVSEIQSTLHKQGLTTSRRITRINNKFKGKQNNFLNHVTRFIIDECEKQDVGTIILGYNKDFQYKPNMGPRQNQIFTHMN